MTVSAWPFIEIDACGRPRILGTSIKVLLFVQQYLEWSWDDEQAQENYPQLSLAQIHAALGYYYEHQAECDRQISADQQEMEQLRIQSEDADWQRKLRELKTQQ